MWHVLQCGTSLGQTKRKDLLSFHSLLFFTSHASLLAQLPLLQQRPLHLLHSFTYFTPSPNSHSSSNDPFICFIHSHASLPVPTPTSPAKHSSSPSFIHILHLQSNPHSSSNDPFICFIHSHASLPVPTPTSPAKHSSSPSFIHMLQLLAQLPLLQQRPLHLLHSFTYFTPSPNSHSSNNDPFICFIHSCSSPPV